jgi:hypothetical protein
MEIPMGLYKILFDLYLFQMQLQQRQLLRAIARGKHE